MLLSRVVCLSVPLFNSIFTSPGLLSVRPQSHTYTKWILASWSFPSMWVKGKMKYSLLVANRFTSSLRSLTTGDCHSSQQAMVIQLHLLYFYSWSCCSHLPSNNPNSPHLVLLSPQTLIHIPALKLCPSVKHVTGSILSSSGLECASKLSYQINHWNHPSAFVSASLFPELNLVKLSFLEHLNQTQMCWGVFLATDYLINVIPILVTPDQYLITTFMLNALLKCPFF